MILRIATILFAFMLSAQCFAQTHLVRAEQLDEHGVFDVFTIGDMAFVIKDSAVFDTTQKETDLSKLISPAAAVKSGLPDKLTADLIDRLLHVHHEPDLEVASAVSFGDDGYLWKLKWHLFPSLGGFTGIPFEYHAIVLPDGTQATPELYLCDDYGSFTAEPEETLFSVLAIDDLLPITKTKTDEDEIKRAAENTFNKAISEFKIDGEFRTLTPQRRTYSSKFTTKGTDDKELEVWAVRFVLSSIENPKNVKYLGSIVVWVTSDLKTSKLTLGIWDAKSTRNQSIAK